MRYLYKITNTLNNKVYIGQTNDDKYRWRQHVYFSKHPEKTAQYIHYAMAKYGAENFSYEIIATCLNQKDADEVEEQLIKQYAACDKDFGYNIKPGGATRKGFKQSEETKQKMSQEWYFHHTPESIEKTAATNRGRHGKSCSEKQKQKISQANKGKLVGYKQSEETIQKRMDTIASQYGDKKCNAPECDRTDGHKVNGVRYCVMHAQRVRKTGSTELQPRPEPPNKGKPMSAEAKDKLSQSLRGKVAHNKGKSHSQETIEKLRELNLGKEPPNKMQFSQEQISSIVSDTRSLRKIARDLGVSTTVIQRIKRQYA